MWTLRELVDSGVRKILKNQWRQLQFYKKIKKRFSCDFFLFFFQIWHLTCVLYTTKLCRSECMIRSSHFIFFSVRNTRWRRQTANDFYSFVSAVTKSCGPICVATSSRVYAFSDKILTKMGHDNRGMVNSTVSLSMPPEPRGSYRGSNEFIRKYFRSTGTIHVIYYRFHYWRLSRFICQVLLVSRLNVWRESRFWFFIKSLSKSDCK